MIVRQLKPEEYARLDQIQSEVRVGAINLETSWVAVVEDAGEIVGFGVLHYVPHFEPFWVREDKRGRGAFQRLTAYIHKCFPSLAGVYCCATKPRVAKLIEHNGAVEIHDARVFRFPLKEN